MELKPRAKPGLLATDHSKRGQRFVTVLDAPQKRVTLLAPWEHAILVLCDGARTANEIAELLRDGVDGEPVSTAGVRRSFQFFRQQGLTDSEDDPLPPPGPKTLANLQQAYREWHKDPAKTGRILSGLLSPPLMNDPPPFRPSLGPTVALPDPEDRPNPVSVGSTLVVDGPPGDESRALRSVLDRAGAETEARSLPASEPVAVVDEELANVADLLAAVDVELADVVASSGLAEASDTDRDAAWPDVDAANTAGAEATSIVDRPKSSANPPLERDADPRSVTEPRDETQTGTLLPEPARRFRHRKLSEAALTPTMVGQAPPEGDGPPVIVSPPRSPSQSAGPASSLNRSPSRSAGDRVMATIGPEPQPDAEETSTMEDTLPVGATARAATPAD